MQSSPLWTGLLLLLLATAQGLGQTHSSGEHFEDADKSSEYTDQQFDLRHTIPGEPGLDYPILSAPPKTSFVCKGRHEGYYADVESRCQAFRICAHTARTPQGFGFLCPNGTLFSQKNFVCDWYRNVNCDDSERYYDMNVDNSVGSTHEMMERVRHMMEYPMKTISKALQQAQAHPQTHPQQQQQLHQHQTLSKDLSSASGVLSHPEETRTAARGEAIKSEPLNAAGLETISPSASTDDDGEGIYVNSLGELSSDPGIQFDHTNAHIVAEYPREYHYQKQKNFAERVNAGLELLADTESTSGEALAPDYMKHIRSNKDEATQVDLVSNINNLLDEVSSDVDPSISGYQSMAPTKIKQPFRFLSRGFAMHGDGSKRGSSAYVYNKPRQTPGTVRFTNFKSAQSKGSAPAQSQSQSQQYRPLTKTNSVGSRSSSGSSSSRNSIGYNKPATAPAISSLTVPPRPSQLPQPALPTPPGIVIVRAEGQRIAPNSASNIIASLATQAPAKATQGSSYVSLNDFFSSKFGQANANSVAGATTLQQQQQTQVQRQPAQQQQAQVQRQPAQQQQVQVQRQPAQQQHHVQQQVQQVQQQQQQHQVQVQQQAQRQQQPQQQLNYITQQYQQPQQTIYQPNIYHQQQAHSYHQQQQQQQHPFQQQQQQQQFHQQSRPSIQTNQQPYLTPNIFVPYQQQQQQLPQFPPLAPPAAATATGSVQGSFIGGRHVDHLNVQLPTLANGLIPGLQLAQKRSDVSAHQLQLTDTNGRHPSRSGSGKSRERSFYSGRTSYQVPQSSVGRLPNDITQQLRGRLRRY